MRHAIHQSFEAIVPRDELRATASHVGDGWLHPCELAEFERLRDAGSREAWRLGRWLAKQLVRDALDNPSQPFATIAICSRNERRQSVRPVIAIDEQVVPWSLSISHSEQLVAAVLDTRPGIQVGVDVAVRQEFRPGFLKTWFRPSERAWAESGAPEIAAVIWAAKEAVYKAFNDGESFAPHMVEILECRDDDSTGVSGRLAARYRGCDVSAECEIEYRTLDRDVVVIARRGDGLTGFELSRELDGELIGEMR